MNWQAVSGDAQYLAQDDRFRNMPASIQEWIVSSPNATADFAVFFRKGGVIEEREDVRLPFYSPNDPPKIVINQSQWNSLQLPGAPEWPQRHVFGTLAHEIGHDRYNTGTVPFTGTTADEYVQYRSGLEAQAIFNAYPIFRDLENNPTFSPPPFESIGYLNSLELGAMYKQWRSGELDDKAVVDQIASKVADRPYTLGGPVRDMNRDGVLTHRDNYLQDFEQYVKPKLDLQQERTQEQSQTQGQPRSMLDRMYEAVVDKDEKAMDAILDEYAHSPQGQVFQREIDMQEKLWLAEVRQAELQNRIAEQQQQIERQQQVHHGPVMRM